MSLEISERGSSYLRFVAVGLVLYCVLLTAITGDIGFNGDDWWILALPYWDSLRHSLVLYAQLFLRPIEGFYWIGLFELFGFNKVAFHLCSLLLLAGSASLMGVSLDRAFPGRRAYVSIAVLLAFFLPPVSCLTYVMFTDNSRLSMLLFWISVLAFQRWAQKSSPWHGLALPVALYVASFLTYESPSFLIFVTPLLVWPVHRRCSGAPSNRAFVIRLAVGIMVGFSSAVAIRFLLLHGGAVGHSHFLPPFELFWTYLALLPFYLFVPFTSMSADRWALLAGVLVVLGTASLLLFSRRDRSGKEMPGRVRSVPDSTWLLVPIGGGILLLGMLPYQLAGYGICSPRLLDTLMNKLGVLPQGDLSWFNFSWASRIYSSSSFGVAILLAAGLCRWQNASARLLGKIAAVVVIGFMAVFHAGLSLDWREAAEIRNDLIRSLVAQVPAVRSGTNFVFLDIDCSHKRAEVIRRWNCTGELVRMLYGDQTVGAWYLYAHAHDEPNHVDQQALATPAGFLSRGQGQNEPAPLDSLLLFKRSGREFVLLDRITSRDGSVPTGVAWQGVAQLTSNFGRIEARHTTLAPGARLARNARTCGLISTLKLSRFGSTQAYLGGPEYGVVYEARRRGLLEELMHRVRSGP